MKADTDSVDISGAADLHVHFSPDGSGMHFDAVTLAREAMEHHQAAIVLKSHDFPTPAFAWAVGRMLPRLHVFGGVACNYHVGGLNPFAVDVALRTGAKIVWLPTLCSRQDVYGKLRDRPYAQRYRPGLTVVDEDGLLLPQVQEIMDLVAQHGAILATGHISAQEHYAITKAFGRRGKLLATHVRETIAGPELSTQQCVELADLGAYIEMAALTGYGKYASVPPAEFAKTARAVGPERCILSSDLGMTDCPKPAEGLQRFADALHDAGLTEAEVRRMAVENPCRFLDVPVGPPAG